MRRPTFVFLLFASPLPLAAQLPEGGRELYEINLEVLGRLVKKRP
jgi:hypothetical protein